ncbi:MAG: tetratricopeptide repeat protein [Archangiaceae bacterium]|nr:tetratricopeptide repeat protein [Archangiaceae bacterium]
MRRSYTLNEVAALLGLSAEHIQALSQSLLGATRDLFTFHEVVLMRTNASRRPARDPVPVSADASYEQACSLEDQDPTGAIDRYLEAVAANPKHADAHVNLGRLLHTRGRLREAEAHYVAALVVRPDDATAIFNLAVVLEDLGRHDDAVTRYQEAIAADPQCVDAYFNLARLYEKKGEKIAAIRHPKTTAASAAAERALWCRPRAAGAPRLVQQAQA